MNALHNIIGSEADLHPLHKLFIRIVRVQPGRKSTLPAFAWGMAAAFALICVGAAAFAGVQP